MYKALFLDLDGTTVPNGRDSRPSDRVTEAIAKAQKYVHVCVATSRPLFLAKPIFDLLHINGLCAINDATQIYDPVHEKIIQTLHVSPQDIKKIYRIYRSHGAHVFLNDGMEDLEYTKETSKREICAILATDVTPEFADEIIRDVSKISDVSVIKVPSFNKGLVWISATNAKATKLHGVVTIAEKLNIKTEEMIGVGDGYNDYPLLSACGLKIAMGNAVEELKAIADFIAPTVEEDGVATVIEKFILPN